MLYPGMPGHDIVGRVLKAGKGVTRHKVGDLVSVDRSFDRRGQWEPCSTGPRPRRLTANRTRG
jgi:alcohol dehydrogenase (NADP+)